MGSDYGITRDKWLTARRVSRGTSAGRNRRYSHGFHAFINRAAAVKAKDHSFDYRTVVQTVFLAGVHTKGIQYDKHCIVANKMYVPLKTKRPPKVTSAKTSAKRGASGKR